MAVDPFQCIELPRLPAVPRIRLLGGVEIASYDILEAMQPALAPLTPVLNIVDAAVAIFTVLDTIPSLDPFAIGQAIQQAASKLAKLLRLLPQLSVPFMVLDTIDALLYELGRFRDGLVRLQQQVESIDAARDRATALGNPQILLDAISCADGNLTIELDNQLSTMQALTKLFTIVDLLLGLIGLGGMPDLSSLGGQELTAAIEELDEIIEDLQELRDTIPL